MEIVLTMNSLMGHVLLHRTATALWLFRKFSMLTTPGNLKLLMVVSLHKKVVICRYVGMNISEDYSSKCVHFCKLISFSHFSQCKGNQVPHYHGKAIACCNDEDECNRYIHPPPFRSRTTTPPPGLGGPDNSIHYVALVLSLIICFLLFSISISVLWLW